MAKNSSYPKKASPADLGSQRPLSGKKLLVGIAAGDAVLSRLAAIFLKEQGANIELVHFRLGKLAQKVRYGENPREPKEELIVKWAKDHNLPLNIVDLSLESDAFCTAWIRHHLSQAWMPDIKSNFDGRFLLPQLAQFGVKLKCDLATGHRARIVRSESGEIRLLKSIDSSIDQSTLLGFAKLQFIKQLYLPVGYLKTEEISKLALAHKLVEVTENILADRMIAQEYSAFESLVSLVGLPRVRSKGYVISVKKVILGEHKGLITAPIGQTRVFEELKESPSRIVLGHDILKNWVIVGSEDQLNRSSCLSSPINWVFQKPDLSKAHEVLSLVMSSDPQNSYPVTAELALGSSLRISSATSLGEAKPFRPRLGSTFTLYRGTLCLGSARIVESFS